MNDANDYELSDDERVNLEAWARLVYDLTGKEVMKLSPMEILKLSRRDGR